MSATAAVVTTPRELDHIATTSGAYRPDVDGLRAIAVGLVVLYHARLGFPGGFIGVDVFFVISGYLITQKLEGDYNDGLPSIAAFYSRRAKRILPALLVVYLACSVAGMAIMLPIDLQELGRSILSSISFVSNFYFYSISGYFDGPAHEKPLLHTWSLSVEEQFYIFWPILCFYVLFKFTKSKQIVFILVGISASIIAAQYFQNNNQGAAFYWPVSRAWELLVGALIAIYPFKFRVELSNVLSVVGLLAIILSGLLLDSRSSVPGVAALPAIIGAALLIMLSPKTIASKVLTNPWIVRLGLISYSLYLWHWPLLAFAKYHLERDPSTTEAILLVVASVGLAAMSWRYVEQPVRRSTVSVRTILATSVVGMVLVAILGSSISSRSQADQVAPLAQAALKDINIFNPLVEICHGQRAGVINTSSQCLIGQTKEALDFVLIGDSHADHFSPAFAAAGREIGLSGIQITHGGCLPIWGIIQVTGGKPVGECNEYRVQVLEYIKRQPPGRTIVLAARWIFYSQTTGPGIEVPYFVSDDVSIETSVSATRRNMTLHLRETIRMLNSLGHRVVLVSQIPEYPFFKLSCFVRHAAQKNAGALCGEGRETLSNLMQPVDDILTQASQGSKGVTIIRPAELLCESGRCVVEKDGVFLYRDLHHLNFRGAEQFSGFFAEALGEVSAASLDR